MSKPTDMRPNEYWCTRESTGQTCLVILPAQRCGREAAQEACDDFEGNGGKPIDEWETVAVENWRGDKSSWRVVGESVRTFSVRPNR